MDTPEDIGVSSLTLSDLGERRIIQEVIAPLVEKCGDDCAQMRLAGGHLCLTTDPAPVPAARALEARKSLFYDGWLSVTINASDLAAAAAEPVGFLAAIECSAKLSVAEFRELTQGIKAACVAEGIPYVGGNIRESERLRVVGTGVGWSETAPPGRVVQSRATSLWSVGQGGIFWRDALRYLSDGRRELAEDSPVARPRSQLRAMMQLRQEVEILAAIDNSDGLLPSLNQIADASGITIELDLDALHVPDSGGLRIDPARLWLGWGDWNVFVALEGEPEIQADIPLVKIGDVTGRSAAGVWLRRGRRRVRAPRLESERFSADSWFSEGLEHYVQRLIETTLP